MIKVPTSDGNRYDIFFVPSGENMITKSFEIRNMSTDIIIPSRDIQLADKQVISFENHSSLNAMTDTNLLTANHTGNIALSLHHESKPSLNPQNPFLTKIWLNAPKEVLPNIEKVIYNLHHTFNPPNVTSYTQNDNFGISFSNWGKFDIQATVYFKTGEIKKITLSKEEWKVL